MYERYISKILKNVRILYEYTLTLHMFSINRLCLILVLRGINLLYTGIVHPGGYDLLIPTDSLKVSRDTSNNGLSLSIISVL